MKKVVAMESVDLLVAGGDGSVSPALKLALMMAVAITSLRSGRS